MAEVENFVLDMLRAIRGDAAAMRGDVAAMHDVQHEHGVRLGELGTAMAGLRRDNAGDAGDAEVSAHVAVRIDKLCDEVDRIKQRPESAD